MSSPRSDASDHVVVVDGLQKRFGSVAALAGASFHLKRGELLGLLGPNGAGKTTAIKAIAGRVVPDAGTIRVLGRVLSPRDERLDIGVVPQEMAVYPLLTARENLEVFGALNGVRGVTLATRVAHALDWSGLGDRAREPVKRFSGGMKRRLNIACSLVHEPPVLLLDEPTVGVDPQSRDRIYEMLSDLQQRGVSIVLTTHHLEEAESRCQRIVILDRGRTVADGTVAELVNRTIGVDRLVRLDFRRPVDERASLPPGAVLSGDRLALSLHITDIARELPRLLERVAAAGADVADVTLSGATLQDVFIKLTGRELRE